MRKALRIFQVEAVEAQAWIAPAHSFDGNTVAALGKCGLKLISDGLAVQPHTDEQGIFWVPQQLWRFRWRPFGVWTVACHHNHWDEAQVERFARDLKNYRKAITDLSAVQTAYRDRSLNLIDSAYSVVHSAVLSMRA